MAIPRNARKFARMQSGVDKVEWNNKIQPKVVEKPTFGDEDRSYLDKPKYNAMGDIIDFPIEYKGLKGEEARKMAMNDFMGYGKELDEKIWEEGSIGHERALRNHTKAREWLASYNPTAYGGK